MIAKVFTDTKLWSCNPNLWLFTKIHGIYTISLKNSKQMRTQRDEDNDRIKKEEEMIQYIDKQQEEIEAQKNESD